MSNNDLPHVEKLRALGACDGPGESIEYASQYATAQEAWDACHRADWMLWLWRRVSPRGEAGQRMGTRLAVACARTAIPFLTAEADRAETAAILDGLDAWAQGGPDGRKELRQRALSMRDRLRQADAAAAAVYAVYAADAADAAVYAAAYAADAADAADARRKHLALMADEIRKILPVCPL